MCLLSSLDSTFEKPALYFVVSFSRVMKLKSWIQNQIVKSTTINKLYLFMQRSLLRSLELIVFVHTKIKYLYSTSLTVWRLKNSINIEYRLNLIRLIWRILKYANNTYHCKTNTFLTLLTIYRVHKFNSLRKCFRTLKKLNVTSWITWKFPGNLNLPNEVVLYWKMERYMGQINYLLLEKMF